ncbi:hypothetical protein [Brevibacillus sp. HD3.3A]|uniref:hypothetical protein n=1 Tax=Brevibacillus sp. HD3.3A TaxID=2738979 RepID=UPI00156B7A4C|nr:hypothetical protein [Brevibacillus sp. HD3.3A]UED72105.1 hypothetical protein HP435_28785 [Brevibacillus sp. HD3.3A]
MKKVICALMFIVSVFSVTAVASADNGPKWIAPPTTDLPAIGTVTPMDNGPKW